MISHAPPPRREELARRAHRAAAMFLRGCAPALVRRYPSQNGDLLTARCA
jgi:hypothetical protein